MASFDQIDSRTIVAIIRGLLTESPTLDSTERILKTVAGGLGWEAAILWEPRPVALYPSSVWARDSGSKPPSLDDAPRTLAEEAWRTAEPVWSYQLAQSNQPPEDVSVIKRLLPGLAFPVTIGDRPSAVIELHSVPKDPDPAQTELAKVLGPLLGDWQERIAYEQDQARLASRLGVAEERQRLLAETSRVLSDSVDEESMMQGLTDQLVPALADACAVHLLNQDRSIRRVAATAIPAITGRLADYDVDRFGANLADEAGVGASIRTGMGMIYSKMTDSLLTGAARSPEHLEMLRSLNLNSAMIAPISGHGGTLGALTLLTADSERTYTTEDLSLLEDIGRRTGIALAGARALQRERTLGMKLQAGLLPPRLPEADWLELAGSYQPARTDTLVGGDFYDCFWISDDRLMFAIGDVCGHGPEAASLTARIRYAAKALARYVDSPSSILDSINQMMIEDGNGESQFTAVYGVIDHIPAGIEISLSRAGHPPPLVVRRAGEVEEIMGGGMLLGFYPDAGLADETVKLEPGDMLFLHTDGLTDARNESEMFGEPRLRATLSSWDPTKSVESFVENIMATVSDFAPEPSDDIALLAIASPR